MWGFQILGAVGGQITVAEIVDEDDQDVWLVSCDGGGWLGQSETREGDESGAKDCIQVHGHSVARALGREQALGERERCQGDHGKYEANYRCCLPALAGFVSPHSVGPDAGNVSLGQARLKAIGTSGCEVFQPLMSVTKGNLAARLAKRYAPPVPLGNPKRGCPES